MNLWDPGTLKAFLGRHGIRAEKGLGQHFLCSDVAVNAISHALAGMEGLLEIGPGPGVLTSPLSKQASKMIALELDTRMIGALAESAPSAEVIQVDALHVNIREILEKLPTPRGVVSNLPYYITAPLLNRIADVRDLFSVAVLMMQREVAQRVVAPPGNSSRGSLSVYLQSHFSISVVLQVPASSFLPPPKVESTILRFEPRPPHVEAKMTEDFYRLVRIGFGHPRKTLANNLMAGYRADRERVSGWIQTVGLEALVRPQALTESQWLALDPLVHQD